MRERNEETYGQVDVPLYYPEDMNLPISLYWSQNDWLADPAVTQPFQWS